MIYVDIAPYLCLSTETIADMEKASMEGRQLYPPHPLEGFANMPALAERAPKQDYDKQWMWTSTKMQGHALAQVDV